MLNARELVAVSVYCSPKSDNQNSIKPLSEVKQETRESVLNLAYDFLSDSPIFKEKWRKWEDDKPKFNVTKKNATNFPSQESFVAMLVTIRLYRSIKSMKKSLTKNTEFEKLSSDLIPYEDTTGIVMHNKSAMPTNNSEKRWYNVKHGDGAKNAAVRESPELAKFREAIWKQGVEFIREIVDASNSGHLPKSKLLFLDYDFIGVYKQYKGGSQIRYDQVFEKVSPKLKGFDSKSVIDMWTESLFPKYSRAFVNYSMKKLKNKMASEYKKHNYDTFDRYYQLLKDCNLV